MKQLRTTLFWIHLTTALLAGLVVLLMSATGVVLAFERQVVAGQERAVRVNVPDGATPLPLTRVLASAQATAKKDPTAVTVRADVRAPLGVSFGRDGRLLVDPYSGTVIGKGASSHAFFEFFEGWHRWLAAEGDGRKTARLVTGTANLLFFFLVLTGLYLWWPRKVTAWAFRNVVFFRRGLSGKARDFNWHNVLGFWAAIPLLIIVGSAVVISFPWANALLFRATGGTPPRPESGARDKKKLSHDIDALWTTAIAETGRAVPQWQTITLRLPDASRPQVNFAVDAGNGARPDLRSQLTLDGATARVARWEPYAAWERGRKARAWVRWLHTGEAGGLPGQIVAALASAAAMVLVWTGYALTLRRFRAWRARGAAA